MHATAESEWHPANNLDLADPTQTSSFFKHFIEELKNQARGTPTDVPPPQKPPKK
jgi:hypothetical protein